MSSVNIFIVYLVSYIKKVYVIKLMQNSRNVIHNMVRNEGRDMGRELNFQRHW